MGWLTDWDDLLHGTLVFAAAVPLGVSLLLGWWLPTRLWTAFAGALVISVCWIFGWPSWPLNGSDDAMFAGLAAGIALVALETARNWSSIRGIVLRAIAWSPLAWLFYPAWLATEGGTARKLFIAATMGFSIAVWSTLVEYLARESGGNRTRDFRITPAAWIPPSMALAVLLQLGGSTQFAQSSGALAAAVGGVCLLLIFKRGHAGLRPLAALWGMLSGLLAWSGWLFAEIQVGPVLALLLSPLAAAGARRMPLPRRNEFEEQLWDGLAAAVLAGVVIGMGWYEYSKGGDSSGY